MGNETSRKAQQEKYNAEVESLEKEARRRYHMRIKAYDYMKHGPYEYYRVHCEAEYQLECIPESCRQGSRYR
jgi:hypothetical protein